MEVNMNETTTDTPKDDGFTIYRVSRRNTRNTGRERYTNKNRRNERMRLLHQVANGTLEPEVAEEALAPASPAPPFDPFEPDVPDTAFAPLAPGSPAAPFEPFDPLVPD